MSLPQQLPTDIIREATFLLLESSPCISLLCFLQSGELTELLVVFDGRIKMTNTRKEIQTKTKAMGKIKKSKIGYSVRKVCQCVRKRKENY